MRHNRKKMWDQKIANTYVDINNKMLQHLLIAKQYDFKMNIGLYLLLSISMIFVSVIVYATGGSNSYIHLMYIPIILSSFLLDPTKAVCFGVFAGLLVGPYMPFNVAEGIMQKPEAWILRLLMFVINGFIVGKLVEYIKKVNCIEKEKAYKDVFTGFPNYSKWKSDFEKIKMEESGKNCSFLLLEIENIDSISRYVGYEVGRGATIKLLEFAEEHFKNGKVYSFVQNKFLIMYEEETVESVYKLAKEYLSYTKQKIEINGFPVAVIMRGGVDSILVADHTSGNIIKRLGSALDQSGRTNKDISIYDDVIAEERKNYYDTLVAIYYGLEKDSFHLVYQPKICTENGMIGGVEALLRWDDKEYGNMSIAQVIQIAEDAGFINQITRWVIKNAMIQLKEWKKFGYEIKIAINLSAKDLDDYSILDFIEENIRLYEIDPYLLEFELTERSVIQNEENVFYILNEIKKLGIKISMDDYGTGHNSLIYLGKAVFQFDYVKIDKLFIDEIGNENTKKLVSGIINAAHGWGIEVIAEGVEHKEQLNTLIEMGCDMVQGYYYSKPLSSVELEKYIIAREEKYFAV